MHASSLVSGKTSPPKKLLLNLSTLNKGGALQASIAFVIETLNDTEFDWHYLLSAEVKEQLDFLDIVLADNKYTVCTPTPAKSPSTRRKIKDIVRQVAPDAVFTFFGPAYVRFDQPHLMGVADGWVTHSNRLAYRSLSDPLAMLRMLMLSLYKGLWFRRATHWVVEAECARRGLYRRLGIAREQVGVVANTCGNAYLQRTPTTAIRDKGRIRILTLSAYHPHKCLECIPAVSQLLRNKHGKRQFEFWLTLPEESREWLRIKEMAIDAGVTDHVHNIGPVAIKDGPAVYAATDITFLPSVLETFSANYPEAMAMGKPIVTTGLPFATDVCQSAALYFQPMSAEDAAEKIARLMNEPALHEALVTSGKEVLKGLNTIHQKTEQYKQILRSMFAGQTMV